MRLRHPVSLCLIIWPGHPVLFLTDQSRAGAHSANEGSENWLLLNLLTVICFQALLLSLAGGLAVRACV